MQLNVFELNTPSKKGIRIEPINRTATSFFDKGRWNVRAFNAEHQFNENFHKIK